MEKKFDTIISGGRVIDPANKLDGKLDVGIKDNKISAVEKKLKDKNAEMIDATGKLVIPGMIDTHAHVFEHAINLTSFKALYFS